MFLYLATFTYAAHTGGTTILYMNTTEIPSAVVSTPTPPRLGTFQMYYQM